MKVTGRIKVRSNNTKVEKKLKIVYFILHITSFTLAHSAVEIVKTIIYEDKFRNLLFLDFFVTLGC